MDNQKRASIFLGIDIGNIHSRAALFNVLDGKYRVTGCKAEQTSLGTNLATGTGHAIRSLQKTINHILLRPSGGLIIPPVQLDEGVDHMSLVTSVGDWARCALIGLTESGSMATGKMLLNSLPVNTVAEFSLANLANQQQVIEALGEARPEIILLAGGEEEGAQDKVRQWVDVVRLALRLIPQSVKPDVIFAGNSLLNDDVSRRLEPLSMLYQRPNIFPRSGLVNIRPTQSLLNQLIIALWEEKIAGLSDLGKLSKGSKSTSAFAHDRIVRYMGQSSDESSKKASSRGVMAINLGGGSSLLSARMGEQFGTVIQPAWPELSQPDLGKLLAYVFKWTASLVSRMEAEQFVCNHALNPQIIPETTTELALSQAVARFRIRQALEKFASVQQWLEHDSDFGLKGQFEPIVISGDVFSTAPQPGQTMLMVLDGLQLHGISTIVLDRYQIMPLLGTIGGFEPVLPVHVLASDALINLGTVIAPSSPLREGKTILTLHVSTDTGKSYEVDINQGTLRRLVIPTGVTAVLEIEPDKQTDVGFGGVGRGGQLKLTGGLVGVVIDARGRPISLPENDEDRVALLRQWHGVLGG